MYLLKRIVSLTIRSDNEKIFTNMNPNNFLAFDRWFQLKGHHSSRPENHLHFHYYPLMQLTSLTELSFFVRMDVRNFCLPTPLFTNLARLQINVLGIRCAHFAIICPDCCREKLELKLTQKLAFVGKIELRNKEFIHFLNTIQN